MRLAPASLPGGGSGGTAAPAAATTRPHTTARPRRRTLPGKAHAADGGGGPSSRRCAAGGRGPRFSVAMGSPGWCAWPALDGDRVLRRWAPGRRPRDLMAAGVCYGREGGAPVGLGIFRRRYSPTPRGAGGGGGAR